MAADYILIGGPFGGRCMAIDDDCHSFRVRIVMPPSLREAWTFDQVQAATAVPAPMTNVAIYVRRVRRFFVWDRIGSATLPT